MPLRILENVRLAPMTTLQVGGPARYFASATTEDEVAEAFDYARVNRLPVFVLGGGSNILVADSGFDGLAIKIGLKGIIQEPISDGVTLIAAAGEDWDALVSYCVDKALAGVECLSGIPGLVGGTPVQNVGAYGQEVSETISWVRCFDRESFDLVELTSEQCKFEYRKSIFNSTHRDRFVVLSVAFELVSNGEPKVASQELAEFFAGRKPTLHETRAAILQIRRRKSMVIDASDPNSRSAGSFFKNPVVSEQLFNEISAGSGQVPNFPATQGQLKIPAAWLIEEAGFSKGYEYGNVGISSNHTLAIVNRGDATADEIIALKNAIQERVFEKFGILLEPEPVLVGF